MSGHQYNSSAAYSLSKLDEVSLEGRVNYIAQKDFFFKDFQKSNSGKIIHLNSGRGYAVTSYALTDAGSLEVNVQRQAQLGEYQQVQSYQGINTTVGSQNVVLSAHESENGISKSYKIHATVQLNPIEFFSWVEKRKDDRLKAVEQFIKNNHLDIFHSVERSVASLPSGQSTLSQFERRGPQ